MGWWETDNGDVLGDGPADILDELRKTYQFKTVGDLPEAIVSAITEEYEQAFGRGPTPTELAALVAFEQGDSSQGVLGKIAGLPANEPGV